ncbi:MAG: YhdH/YhfP family quinone oxidoreductase [Ignavibacteriae bacterium]|nr:YhdH/YhfP family quinone oxidoreductase [Ignavibacteriota bacterium]
MSEFKFKALVVEEVQENIFKRSIKEIIYEGLSEEEVLIKVEYSALNYKDALSARGHKGITRKYPHIPGVDAAGIIEETKGNKFTAGEKVFVTGYDLGMNTDGGFSEFIKVPEGWVIRTPQNFTSRDLMIYGTAGFTAGIAIYEMQRNEITPDKGKILVTGATGGVGCLAIAMLTKAGYYVVASTGKPDKKDFLMRIGAKEVISREDVNDSSGKALLKKQWVGAIDNVGGNTLNTVIRSMEHRGVVASIGLVQSDKIESTVYPFILRGIRLIGIDSAESPMDYRLKIWNKIFNEWRINSHEDLVKECSLFELDKEINLILNGGQTGKVIVKIESEK